MYVGNTNTKRCHSPSCRAVPTIYPEHVEPTEDGKGFYVLCKWCGVQGEPSKSQTRLEDFKVVTKEEQDAGIQDCEDGLYKKLFEATGCITCKSKEGRILMYPHSGGVKVEGIPGLWWVFFECDKCQYQTSFQKAINKLEREKGRGIDEK